MQLLVSANEGPHQTARSGSVHKIYRPTVRPSLVELLYCLVEPLIWSAFYSSQSSDKGATHRCVVINIIYYTRFEGPRKKCVHQLIIIILY